MLFCFILDHCFLFISEILSSLNRKVINNLYEEYVLGVGDFDERIFLGEDAQDEIGTPGGQNASDLSEQMAKRCLKQHFDEVRGGVCSTLSGIESCMSWTSGMILKFYE